MVNEYTRCDPPFPDKDIFFALAGIAEKFGQLYDNQYVAGLFRQHLPFDLLWQNKGSIAKTYRAPSWSWPSIEGLVEMRAFSDCPFCDKCSIPLAGLHNTKVELVDPGNIYGQVRSAELTLRGYLLPCQIEPIKQAGTNLRQRLAIFPRANDDATIIRGSADIDDNAKALRRYPPKSQSTAWVLPIVELKSGSDSMVKHHGLVVEECSNEKYVRVGIYQLMNYVMDQVVSNGLNELREIVLV